MTQPCPTIEVLADFMDLPSGDGRLRHLDECAECRALLRSMREFRDPTIPPEGIDVSAAEASLRETLHEQLRISEPGRARTRTRTLLESIFPRRLRWGLVAVTSATAVLAITNVIRDSGGDRWTGSERSLESIDSHGAPADLLLTPPKETANGSMVLSWARLAGTDRYEVVFYGSDLEEIGRHDTGTDSSLTLGAELLRQLASPGEEVAWRVEAIRSGDSIRASSPGALTIP